MDDREIMILFIMPAYEPEDFKMLPREIANPFMRRHVRRNIFIPVFIIKKISFFVCSSVGHTAFQDTHVRNFRGAAAKIVYQLSNL
jgi:hypothetical protein